MPRLFALLIALLQLLLCEHALADTYYISAKGSDTRSGTSPAEAWRSIGKANSHLYSPSDTLLFEGRHTFQGSLYFEAPATPPSYISSFGEGRATIYADSSFGFYAHNLAGITLKKLHFKGSGYTSNRDHGILFYNDLPGVVKLSQVVVDQVEVSGFRKSGITVGSWNGNSGYSDVSITNAVIYDIGSEGITTWGEFNQNKKGYAHQNVYVGHSHVYQIHGLPLPDKHSGSGIVLSDVDGGTVEHSVVHTSGMNNLHCGGPVGIWAWDANAITIQYNEAYNMSAGKGCDGGGFDLDGGVTNSVMQYNYSHDNDGAGFLIAQFEWARPMHNNVIRYNISENDGRRNGYKGITLWVADRHNNGGNRSLLVYNNTVFADKAVAPSSGGVFFKSGGHHGVRFFNNIFYTRNRAPMVVAATDTALDVSFRHNTYYSEGNLPTYTWGTASYTSLAAFREATDQEILNGTPSGSEDNPELTAPGTAGTLGYPIDWQELQARYSPRRKSPVVEAGIATAVPSPFQVATHDLAGQSLRQETAPDKGAITYPKPKRLRWLRELFSW